MLDFKIKIHYVLEKTNTAHCKVSLKKKTLDESCMWRGSLKTRAGWTPLFSKGQDALYLNILVSVVKLLLSMVD